MSGATAANKRGTGIGLLDSWRLCMCGLLRRRAEWEVHAKCRHHGIERKTKEGQICWQPPAGLAWMAGPYKAFIALNRWVARKGFGTLGSQDKQLGPHDGQVVCNGTLAGH